MAIEVVGIKAVIENLQGYLAGVNAMSAADAKLQKAQLSLENTSINTSNAIRNAGQRIIDTESRVEQVRDRVARGVAKREAAVINAENNVARQIAKNGEASAFAYERVANRKRELDDYIKSGAVSIENAENRVGKAIQTAQDVSVNAFNRNQRASIGFQQTLSSLTRSFNPFTAATAAASKGLNAFGSAIIAVDGFSNRFGVSLRFGTAALLAFASAFAIGQASNFEDQLVKIDNLTSATTEDVERLSGELLDLTKTVPTSPADLGAAAYTALSSGIEDVNTAIELTTQAAKAQAVGLGSTQDVVRVATSVLNAYGEENINATQAIDILTVAIREGSAEPEQFARGLGRLLGIAPNLGIEFDQLVSSIAALTNVGLPTEQAMTGLLGIMNQILSPSSQAQEVLEKYGLTVSQLRDAISKDGLIPTLLDLREVFGQNIQDFEKLFPEVRGLNAALILLGDSGEKYNNIANAVANSNGALEEAFQKASETFSFQAGLLRNDLNRALIELGTVALPIIAGAIQDLRNFFVENENTVKDYLAVFEFFINSFAKGVEAINNFLGALNELTNGLSNNILIFGAIGVGLFLLGSLIVSLVGPWVLLAAAIVTAIGIIVANFDELEKIVNDVWESIPDPIRKFIEFFANEVVARITGSINVMINLFNGLKEWLSLLWNVITLDFDGAWTNLRNLASILTENIVAVIFAVFGNLPNLMIGIAEDAVNGVLRVLEEGAKLVGDFKILGVPVGSLAAGVPGVGALGALGGLLGGGGLGRVSLPRLPAPEFPDLGINLDSVVKSFEKVTGASQDTSQNLNEIPPKWEDVDDATDEAGDAAEKAADEIRSLAEEFKKSSEAARQVESLTKNMDYFGQVSYDLARALGLTAEQAGAVQAYDALQAELERSERKAFDFAKTMATVANAFQYAANIARRIVLDLSRDALEASRTAANAIFSRPTREVASLQLTLAQVDLEGMKLERLLEPQIESLEKQLDRLTETTKNQVDAIEAQIDSIEDASDRRIEAIDEEIDRVNERNDKLNDSLDRQIRMQREIARDAERQARLIDDEIDSLIEFLEYAELSAGQREYVEANIEALQNQRTGLIRSQNAAEEAADALEEQQKALKDATDSQVDALKRQQEAIEKSTESQVEALEKQRDAIERNAESQEKAIQTQIDTLQAQLDLYADQSEAIQHQIDMYTAQSDILQRQIELADATLLTQEEQRQKAEELIGMIAEESRVVRDLSQQIGVDLIPEMDLAREAFRVMKDAVNILNNPSISTLISQVDAAALHAGLLAAAEEKATTAAGGAGGGGLSGALDNLTEKTNTAGSAFVDGIGQMITRAKNTIDEILRNWKPAGSGESGFSPNAGSGGGVGGSGGGQWAEGGIVNRHLRNQEIGEEGPEAILPLTNPGRAREVIASIPSHFLQAIMGYGGSDSRGMSLNIDHVTIMDPRRDTGPIGDMAYSSQRALRSRGVLT